MKLDKEASKKLGVKVMKGSAPKAEVPKKKSWEKKDKEEEKKEVGNDFVRDED